MKSLHIVQNVQAAARQDDIAFVTDSDAKFTPADFLKDAGTIIAVCLGLGLLVQILLG